MKAVGIKVLKNQLSRYLKLAREGELILVTDRDQVVAEIHRPTQPLHEKISQWEAFLNEEERRGSLIRAKKKRINSLKEVQERPPWPASLEKLASSIYEQEREDRLS